MPILANARHEAFARLIAAGSETASAYRGIYKEAKGDSAKVAGCRLLTNINVSARVLELQKASETKLTMNMQERRERLARCVRINLSTIDLSKDGDLVQEITPNEHGVKLKLPGKRECIMDDATLSGDIKAIDRGVTVNVGVNVNVITEEERAGIMAKKQAAIAARLAAQN